MTSDAPIRPSVYHSFGCLRLEQVDGRILLKVGNQIYTTEVEIPRCDARRLGEWLIERANEGGGE